MVGYTCGKPPRGTIPRPLPLWSRLDREALKLLTKHCGSQPPNRGVYPRRTGYRANWLLTNGAGAHRRARLSLPFVPPAYASLNVVHGKDRGSSARSRTRSADQLVHQGHLSHLHQPCELCAEIVAARRPPLADGDLALISNAVFSMQPSRLRRLLLDTRLLLPEYCKGTRCFPPSPSC
ncbi:hypothetical protein EJ06DRAFT_188008 [Trichodelitschia bisporula]|uniref:Uncharacterized protein n=1 Tax=Trichodelitschia bisporula TaxID=703511 RepID=A0A6G1I7J7_9PEZI|nr:hypothetical protein EJ06DRAFT_188008 [Trichodelitschia bisporula]